MKTCWNSRPLAAVNGHEIHLAALVVLTVIPGDEGDAV